MNLGRYPDGVINEAVKRMDKGDDPKDVADELREKHGYEKLHPRTVERWYKTYPMGKQPKSLPPKFKEAVHALVREYASQESSSGLLQIPPDRLPMRQVFPQEPGDVTSLEVHLRGISQQLQRLIEATRAT